MSDARTVLLQLHAESANDTDMRGRFIHALTAALLATMAELDRLDEERRRRTERVTWGEYRTFRRVDIRQIITAALEPLDCGPDLAAERTDWVDDDTMSAEETTQRFNELSEVTVVHREPDGTWWAESPELEGFTAVAETPEALRELIAEGVDFHLDEIDRLREAAKAATSGSPVVDAISNAGIDAVWSQMVPVRMTDAEYEEWCAAMDEIKGRPPGTTLEAGRTRCRASMTITGWPTRYCVEPKGHDGPHYAGDRHTWGVTWNAVDPDDYTGR